MWAVLCGCLLICRQVWNRRMSSSDQMAFLFFPSVQSSILANGMVPCTFGQMLLFQLIHSWRSPHSDVYLMIPWVFLSAVKWTVNFSHTGQGQILSLYPDNWPF